MAAAEVQYITQQDLENRRAELLVLKMDKLKKRCKKLKISVEGGKMDMIDRIIETLYIVPSNNASLEAHKEETWDQYANLKLSDDEDNEGQDKSTETEIKEMEQPFTIQHQQPDIRNRALSVPVSQLKSKGSVVDMLMMGPFGADSKLSSKQDKEPILFSSISVDQANFKQTKASNGNPKKSTKTNNASK